MYDENYRSLQSDFEDLGVYDHDLTKNFRLENDTIDDAVHIFDTNFDGSFILENITFVKPVVFLNCTFERMFEINEVSFEGGCDFSNVIFKDTPKFKSVDINSYLRFYHCTFQRSFNFQNKTIESEVSFEGTSFKKWADFRNFNCERNINFSNSIFEGEANFKNSHFKGEVDFTHSSFDDSENGSVSLNFKNSTFEDNVWFVGENFSNPIFENSAVNFTNIDQRNVKIHFQNANLQQTQFLNTVIEDIEFQEVDWPTVHYGTWSPLKYFGRNHQLYDEKLLRNNDYLLAIKDGSDDLNAPDLLPWGKVERLYRQLKKNREDRRDYSSGGEFHIGEKEMKFESPDTSKGMKFLLFCYKYLSFYGERALPPFLGLMALIVISSVFYLGFGLQTTEETIYLCLKNCEGYWSSLKVWLNTFLFSTRTASLFGTLNFKYVHQNLSVQIIMTLERIISPLLLATLVFAIRQRIRR